MSRRKNPINKISAGKDVVAVLVIASLALLAAAYVLKTYDSDKHNENSDTPTTTNTNPPAITGNPLTSNDKQTPGSPSCGAEDRGGQSVDNTGQAILTVEEVISKPDDFIGSSIIVHGTVVETYPLKQLFTIGCSCKNIPVNYDGALPGKGSDVSVYGSVKKSDGGYVFEAEKVV